MGFLIGLLTLLMVLDCIVLTFLVLIQLPKKEAGAGLAFGGAASDALFGAGSGNVLTKITKYVAGFFFGLAILLSLVETHAHSGGASTFEQRLSQPPTAPATMPPPVSAPVATPSAPANKPATMPGTNLILSTPTTTAESTTVPAAPASTNAPAPAPPK